MSEKFLRIGINGEPEEVLGFLTNEFINVSVGAADAGKPVVLDAAGQIDSSMVNVGTIDHGLLLGLADDDHTIYSLADGTRPYSAIVSYIAHPAFSIDTQLVDKKYVDDVAAGSEWQDSILDADLLTPPGAPTTGDRYLINGVGAGAWAGQDNAIAEWNGTAWIFTAPLTGMRVGADDEPNVAFYLYGGVSWTAKLLEATTASTGLVKVGQDIQIDASTAGNGLGFSAGVLSANVDGASIEITTDTLNVKALGITDAMLAGSISDAKLLQDYIQTSEVDNTTVEFAGGTLNVKDLGINALKIDWGLGANQVSAGDVPLADAAGFTAETDVEGAVQELYGLLSDRGVELTSAGVSKGDLVFVSVNDTLATYSNISTFHKAVGLANATVAAAAPVKSLSNDTRVNGLLAGAIAGDVYYWDGTNHVNSIPVGSGSYVIQTGTAINATDLYVEVRLVKKNI